MPKVDAPNPPELIPDPKPLENVPDPIWALVAVCPKDDAEEDDPNMLVVLLPAELATAPNGFLLGSFTGPPPRPNPPKPPPSLGCVEEPNPDEPKAPAVVAVALANILVAVDAG